MPVLCGAAEDPRRDAGNSRWSFDAAEAFAGREYAAAADLPRPPEAVCEPMTGLDCDAASSRRSCEFSQSAEPRMDDANADVNAKMLVAIAAMEAARRVRYGGERRPGDDQAILAARLLANDVALGSAVTVPMMARIAYSLTGEEDAGEAFRLAERDVRRLAVLEVKGHAKADRAKRHRRR